MNIYLYLYTFENITRIQASGPSKIKNLENNNSFGPLGGPWIPEKPRFDPVRVVRGDDLDTITNVGGDFVYRFLGNAHLQKAVSTDLDPG